MKKSNSNNIIIIPARAGSKGIKNKNLSKFCGKPLIYWTIKQALMTKDCKEIYVTSDSKKILKYSKNLGVKVIKRPAKYSLDNSPSEEAILHAMNHIEEDYKTLILLQPTSPLRKKNDVDNALNEYYLKNSESLFSCHNATHNFDIWSKEKKNITPLFAESSKTFYKKRKPRQLIKKDYFQQNGSIYIFSKNLIKKRKNRLGGKINVFVMEEWQSFQLDAKKQLFYMQLLFEKFLKKEYSR